MIHQVCLILVLDKSFHCSGTYTKVTTYLTTSRRATAVLGEIGAYDPTDEEWPNYVEMLRSFNVGVTDNGKKRSVFIAVVELKSYNLLRNLVAPAKPKEKTLDELIEVLSDTTIRRCQRWFHFNTRGRPC